MNVFLLQSMSPPIFFAESGRVSVDIQQVILQLEGQSDVDAELIQRFGIGFRSVPHDGSPSSGAQASNTAVFSRIISIYSSSVTSVLDSNSMSLLPAAYFKRRTGKQV